MALEGRGVCVLIRPLNIELASKIAYKNIIDPTLLLLHSSALICTVLECCRCLIFKSFVKLAPDPNDLTI